MVEILRLKNGAKECMCRSRRELSNEYLLAKFGFNTAENEPSKVCRIPRHEGLGGLPRRLAAGLRHLLANVGLNTAERCFFLFTGESIIIIAFLRTTKKVSEDVTDSDVLRD